MLICRHMKHVMRLFRASVITARQASNRVFFTQACPQRLAIFATGIVLVAFSASPQAFAQGVQQDPTTSQPDCSYPQLQGSEACQTQQDNTLAQPRFQQGAQSQQGSQPLSLGTGNGTGNPVSEDSTTDRGRQSNSQQTPPSRLPPEPLTEFQRFVASTNGVILPVYGADLFRSVPTTFAPVESTPVPDDYVMGPGDELLVRIWGPVNFQAPLRIDREGEIFIPQVGSIHVAGLPYSDVVSHVREGIGKVFRNFQLSVDIGQIRTIQIYVTGQARRPGLYTISSLSSIVDAVFASGGPSVEGSMRKIELRRGGKTLSAFDLYRLLIYGDKSGDAKLLPGDVIYIAPVGPQVALMGSVRKSAIYELKPDETVEQLIADAAGLTSLAAQARLTIERIDVDGKRQAMELKYDAAGLSAGLRGGDLVRVFSIVPEYKDTVTLRGNVANAGRFAWHQGMKVSDLIPDKDSLVTRNYWWRRTQLGIPSPDFEPVPGFSNLHQPIQDEPVSLRDRQRTIQQRRTDLSSQGYLGQGYPGQGIQGQGNQGQDLDVASLGGLGNAGSVGNSRSDTYSLMQSGTNSADQDRSTDPQQRSASSTLAGAVTAPSSRTSIADQRIGIANLAPEIDWDYAVVERFNPSTLKAELLPFDLGHLVLQHEASQDLTLEPGDVVTVFSEADIRVPLAHQTKFITLDGEFAHAGIYVAEPGETLRHLVARAGGLSPNAYLYGSELIRESARRSQQIRIDEYVQKLSQDVARSGIAVATSATSSPQDIASAAAAQESERQLLAGLRQLRATGRVVVGFNPDAQNIEAIPDLPLEDGDRFTVPSVVGTVNVIGSVNNPNSFLYLAGSSAGSYLHMAGGPDRNADSNHSFIVRANGEVIARKRGDELWNGAFHNVRLYPGDSIVVPEKTFRPSALRGFLEITQLFSQLALGAAAISILQ